MATPDLPDLYRTIWGAAYCTPIRAASVHTLLSVIRPLIPSCSHGSVVEGADRLISAIHEAAAKVSARAGDAKALHMAVGNDLANLRRVLVDAPGFYTDPIEDRLTRAYERIITSFASLGIDLRYATFEIVDEYPVPYAGLDFWAMNYDATDAKVNALSIGTRLKRTHMLPYFSESLLAHELTHSCFGYREGTRLARGLEEGLCDLVGHLLIGSQLLPWDYCCNIVVNSRLPMPLSRFWMNYAESLRQAAVLLGEWGLSGIVDLISLVQQRGRDYLTDLERSLLAGELPNPPARSAPSLPKWAKEIEPKLLRFTRRFLAYPQSLVVSPVALHLAERFHVGDKIADLIVAANLDDAATAKAIDELRQSVFLVIVKDGQIVFDETKLYLGLGCLRYSATNSRKM